MSAYDGIIERIAASRARHSVAQKEIDSALAEDFRSIRTCCGLIGHIFDKSDWPLIGDRDECRVCGERKDKPQGGGGSVTSSPKIQGPGGGTGTGGASADPLVELLAEVRLMRADLAKVTNMFIRVTRGGEGMLVAADSEIPTTVVT